MKILFVLEYYYPHIGGVEKLFQTLAEALAERGHDITVATTRFKNELPTHEELNGVEVIRLHARNRFAFTLLSIPKVAQLAKESELIHTTSYNAAVPSMIAGWIRSKKVIITFHEVWGRLWFQVPFLSALQRQMFYHYEKLVLRFDYSKVIAVSEYTRQCLVNHGVSPSRISVIYNGIDDHEFAGLTHQPPDQPVFTYFGRLGVSKGLDLIIPAFARFKQQNSTARLRMILPRYPRFIWKQLQQLIEKYQLDGEIEFHHELKQQALYQLIVHSTAILIPSYSEGFCFAAAESVALDVPVISSGNGALKEVVSGKFIELEKLTVENLYIAMKKATNKAWQHNQKRSFNLGSTINGYLKLYQET